MPVSVYVPLYIYIAAGTHIIQSSSNKLSTLVSSKAKM